MIIIKTIFLCVLVLNSLNGCIAQSTIPDIDNTNCRIIPIVLGKEATRAEQIAAKDLQIGLSQIYPHLRFPVGLEKVDNSSQILVGTPNSLPILKDILLHNDISSDEAFVVTHQSNSHRSMGIIAGKTGSAVLYGVYHLMERLGRGYYLSFDTDGTQRESFSWNGWDLKDKPMVVRRMVFNWHNFLSGCSTWREKDWKLWIQQSQKMGYNTIMVHAYGNNPMAGFSFRGQQKPVGYLSSTRIGRDWSTNHVNDVRNLQGGTVFKEKVFGCDASINGTDKQRTCAAQELMRQVFVEAADRQMNIYFAVDVDTTSANPPALIESLDVSERFQSKGHWLPRPDKPGGYAFYRAQVEELLRVYPQLNCLVVWHRAQNTPWMSFAFKDMPKEWQDEYAKLCKADPKVGKLWHSMHIFAQAKIVAAFERAAKELGRPDVKIAYGSWHFSFMAAADCFMSRQVELIGLDYDVLHNRSVFTSSERRAGVARVARNRSVIPIAWAQHDDGNYVGRPFTPYTDFYDKLLDMDCANSGYGIIHWTTWPLDIYFKSLVQQVWEGSKNEPLSVTCSRMARDLIGPDQADIMAGYLEDWVTTMQKVGRETSNYFSDKPIRHPDELLAELPGVKLGYQRRMKRLKQIDLDVLSADAQQQVTYFKGLENFILSLYKNDSYWIYARRALDSGKVEEARHHLKQADPEKVISDFALFSKANGMTRGEQGLVITMNLRWLPYFVQLRQQLGMEAVRYNFAQTSHDPLAQSPGIYTFMFDQNRAVWQTLGRKETGLETFTFTPGDLPLNPLERDILQEGIKSKEPFDIHVGAILTSSSSSKAALLPGEYELTLWCASPTESGEHLFKVNVFEKEMARATRNHGVYRCAPVTGQWLKIVCNGNSENNWNSIYEVRCKALKAGQRPRASGYADGVPPGYALDGNPNTRWAAEGKAQWLQLELDPDQSFDTIELDWYKANARVYDCKFLISTDGVSWKPVVLTNKTSKSEQVRKAAQTLATFTIRLKPRSAGNRMVKCKKKITLKSTGVIKLTFEPLQGEAVINGVLLSPCLQ